LSCLKTSQSLNTGTSAEGLPSLASATNESQRGQQRDIERLAEWIASRGLVSPAILLFEFAKPLFPIGSQALLLVQPLIGFLGPLMGWVGDEQAWSGYVALLEDPQSIERIVSRLEQLGQSTGKGSPHAPEKRQ
jgi:hypothetical protein